MPPAGIEAGLAAQGWTPLRASATGYDDSYDLFALRGHAALWIRERGAAPDLDGWTAGRELLFSRGPLAGGAPAPQRDDGMHLVVSDPAGASASPASASGHCAGLTRGRRTLRRHAALRTSRARWARPRRRAAQPVAQAGDVAVTADRRARAARAVRSEPHLRARHRPRILGAPAVRHRQRAPAAGREVCFAGRTSGTDLCGDIIESYPGTGGLPCTTITARPRRQRLARVHAAAADGTVRAVGIATLVFGPFQSMCFTPIGPVLEALSAKLVTAAAG